jgi:hypothetical protein
MKTMRLKLYDDCGIRIADFKDNDLDRLEIKFRGVIKKLR